MLSGGSDTFCIGQSSERPSLKLLYKHVVPGAARKWKDLGVELLSDNHHNVLGIIEANHPQDVEKCCKLMFEKWLETSVDTSWNQLIQSLMSQTVQLNYLADMISEKLDKVFWKVIIIHRIFDYYTVLFYVPQPSLCSMYHVLV